MLILLTLITKTFPLAGTAGTILLIKLETMPPVSEILFRESGWEDAQIEAKSTGKLIFLNFHATWSTPCRMMQYRTFTNNELVEYLNANFINLRLDVEEGEGEALMEAFRQRAYPSTLLIGVEGNLIWGKTGYLGPNELLHIAKEIVE